MKLIDREYPPSIQPIYTTPEPNTPVSLYKGPIGVEQKGKRHNVTRGEILLELRRVPRVIFRVSVPNDDRPYLFRGGEVFLTLKGSSAKVSAAVLSFRIIPTQNDEEICTFTGEMNEPFRVKPRRKVAAVVAHLANFREIFGSPIEHKGDETVRRWRGRTTLVDQSGWTVHIDGFARRNLKADLPKYGGYGITHAMRIQRTSGEMFREEDVAELLADLRYFFSFVRGLWTEPFLLAGISKRGTVVWETWNQPQLDAWRPAGLWCDGSPSVDLESVWPTFRNRLHDPVWGEMLIRAMHWYIAANKQEGGIEGAIVLAQTAHELLSWTRFVTQGKLTTDFEKIKAEDKLRLMLDVMSIPKEIPTQFKVLFAKTRRPSPMDGPQVLVELRNSIVHPKKKRISPSDLGPAGVAEAQRLTMWYLDLLFLNLFGYHGMYSPRFKQPQVYGATETVPWMV